MTPQELKNSILQLAIQGKLVEQRPEEGSAEAPFKPSPSPKSPSRHSASRPPSPVTPEDAPFDIPESWWWVRLGDVVANHGQKTPQSVFSYIDIGSIDNKHQRLSDRENIVHPRDASPRARKIVEKGDVLYATVRPYLHNVCIVDRDFTCEPIASTGFAVMACADCLDAKFLFHFLLSPDFDRYANSSENAKGVAYPAISDKRLYNAPIPLPPLPEQRRIVAKIEELQPLIDRYAEAWTQLEAFNKRFPEDMQKSLLQLAIQGKLVEQRPEEGTAETLYRQIQSEKHRLVQSGKLKKSIPLLPITENEIPFDIPESWKWCRITDCGEFISGYTPKPSDLSEVGSIPYFKVADMNTSGNELYLVHAEKFLIDPAKKYYLKNTIVYPKNGGAVFTNKKRILAQDSVVDLNTGGYFPFAPLNLMFVYIYFCNIDFRKCYKGTALPTIDMDKLKSRLFPLPPLAEQQRIVSKLQELLPLCERLK